MILKVISANRSSLIWVHTVCRYAKNSFEKLAKIFSRRHKQTTFSDAVFLGALRVNDIYIILPSVVVYFSSSYISAGQDTSALLTRSQSFQQRLRKYYDVRYKKPSSATVSARKFSDQSTTYLWPCDIVVIANIEDICDILHVI